MQYTAIGLGFKMEERHKKAIQSNFVSLVETTDLDSMVTALYERGVFSEQMIEPYKDTIIPQRERKRKLYLDITRRGPHAFGNLLEVLKELGYWDLVRDLDPNSSLHLRPHRNSNTPSRPPPQAPPVSSFISLGEEKRKNKSECEPPINTQPAASSSTVTNNNDEIPFIVKKSTKFIEDNENDDIKSYWTRGKKRGVLLLLSYVSFEGGIESYRKGVFADINNLKYLFGELGFTVLSYIDLSLKETEKTLNSLAQVLVDCESVFCVVSSHGYERARSSDTDVRCSDGGLLALRDLIAYFSNQRLPRLAHVPKVFIFQNCRGPSMDYVWTKAGQTAGSPPRLPMPVEGLADGSPTVDEPAGTRHATPERAPTKQALYSNILIAQSTLPGFVSRRDEELGSWYIQTVCQVFAARAHDTHVDQLFTLVDKQLAECYHVQTSSVDRWGFNKRLYLHPGLHE